MGYPYRIYIDDMRSRFDLFFKPIDMLNTRLLIPNYNPTAMITTGLLIPDYNPID